MKGLIIKDLMCMKRHLTVYCFLTVGLFLVSAMLVLSARFGNVARLGSYLVQDGTLLSYDVKQTGVMALAFFMLLPIATVGDIACLFEADRKAGFYKLSGALPVPITKRLLSKYLTVYTLLFFGIITDVLLAGILTVLTDLISFRSFLGFILSSASFLGIYSSLMILYCLLLGNGRETFAQLASGMTMIFFWLAFNLKEIQKVLQKSRENERAVILYFWDLLDSLKERPYIFLIIALCSCIGSFLIALALVHRKRGIV